MGFFDQLRTTVGLDSLDHEVNRNYFAEVNKAFTDTILSGDYQGYQTISTIAKKHEISIWGKIKSAFTAPLETLKWMGTSIIAYLGLDDMFKKASNIVKSVKKASDQLKTGAQSAYSSIQSAITQNTTSPAVLAHLQTLKTAIEKNPAISSQAPPSTASDAEHATYWNQHFDQLNIPQDSTLRAELIKTIRTKPQPVAQEQVDNTKKKREKCDFTDPEYTTRLENFNQYKNENPTIDENSSYYTEKENDRTLIEGQYHVDKTRLKLAEIQNQLAITYGDHQEAIIGIGILTAGLTKGSITEALSSLTSNISDLVKLPFALNGIPLAIFALTGLGIYKYAENNPMMKIDLKDNAEPIKKKIQEDELYQKLKTHFPNIDSQIDQAITFLEDPTAINVSFSPEIFGASKDKLVQQSNTDIQHRAVLKLEKLKYEKIQGTVQIPASLSIEDLISKVKSINPLNIAQVLKELNENPYITLSEKNGILNINLEEIKDQQGNIIPTVMPIMIDPELPLEKQYEITQKSHYLNPDIGHGTNFFKQWWNGVKLQLGTAIKGAGVGFELDDSTLTIYDHAGNILSTYFLGAPKLGWELLKTVFGEETSMHDVSSLYGKMIGSTFLITTGSLSIEKIIKQRKIGYLKSFKRVALPFTLPFDLSRKLISTTGRADIRSSIRGYSTDFRFGANFFARLTGGAGKLENLRQYRALTELTYYLDRKLQPFGSKLLGTSILFKDNDALISDGLKKHTQDLLAKFLGQKQTINIMSSDVTVQNLRTILNQLEQATSHIARHGINPNLDISKYFTMTDDTGLTFDKTAYETDFKKAPKVSPSRIKVGDTIKYKNPQGKEVTAVVKSIDPPGTYQLKVGAAEYPLSADKLRDLEILQPKTATVPPAPRASRTPPTSSAPKLKFKGRGKAGLIGLGIAGLAGLGYGAKKAIEEPTTQITSRSPENEQKVKEKVKSKEAQAMLGEDPESEAKISQDLRTLYTRSLMTDFEMFNLSNKLRLSKEEDIETNIKEITEHTLPTYINKLSEYIKKEPKEFGEFIKTHGFPDNETPNMYRYNINNFVVLTLHNGVITIKTVKTKTIKDNLRAEHENTVEIGSINQQLLLKLQNIESATAKKIDAISTDPQLTEEQKVEQIVKQLEVYNIDLSKMQQELEVLTKKENITQLLKEMAPFIGTKQELNRFSKAIERGEVSTTISSSAWLLLGMVGDIATFGVASTAIKASRLGVHIANMMQKIKASRIMQSKTITKLTTAVAAQKANPGMLTKQYKFILKHSGKTLLTVLGLQLSTMFIPDEDFETAKVITTSKETNELMGNLI